MSSAPPPAAVPPLPSSSDPTPRHPHGGTTLLLPPLLRREATYRRADKMKESQLRERNVKLMFTHVFLLTMYQSICQWNLFDAYLSILARDKGFANSNTWVGFAEGISGLTTLILAIPLGILVDRFDRIRLIRLAAYIGLFATCITAYAFAFDDITTLYANLFLWGLFTGLQSTAAEAVFADSIEKGNRSEKFTLKGVLNTYGLSSGPLLMLVLFLACGDSWGLRELHLPLLVGCIFAPFACIPLFLMQDPIPPPARVPIGTPAASTAGLRTPLLNPTVVRTTTPRIAPSTPLLRRERFGSAFSDYSDIAHEPLPPLSLFDAEERRFRHMSRGERLIPFIVTVADFVTEIGAGMTVRFFPLFFIKDYGLSPTALCCVFCAYPLCVSLGMPMCQRLSRVLGRAQASFLFQCGGISMLLLMTSVQSLPLLILVFMIRGQLQNAVYPVDRSILMDYIPSKHRGKWNSVSALASMTWSGSAVIGGYLADCHDYRFTFMITAIVYTCGLLCYTPLLWLVPRNEADPAPAATSTRHAETTSHPTTTTVAIPEELCYHQPSTCAAAKDLSPVSAATTTSDKGREDEDPSSSSQQG